VWYAAACPCGTGVIGRGSDDGLTIGALL